MTLWSVSGLTRSFWNSFPIVRVTRWKERSLIDTSTCRVWRRVYLGCAQELGESTEKSRSHLAQAEHLFPPHSSMWLILFSSNCLSLFLSTDTRTTPAAAPRPWQGRPALPEALLVASPFLVTLLGLSFGICTRPGMPPCLTSSNLTLWPPWPQPWPPPSLQTPPQTIVVQLNIKPTHCFLPQTPALVHGLFPDSNGCKDGEWGVPAKADKREVMLVSDEMMLQREESSQTCSAFYGLSWLFLSLPMLSHSSTHMQTGANINMYMGSMHCSWKKSYLLIFFGEGSQISLSPHRRESESGHWG